LAQHRTLVEESLRRKIAHLRESVISTLETILARRGGETTNGITKVDTDAATSLLESADEAIRDARRRTVNWSDDRLEFAANLPSLVAKAALAAQASAPASELAGLVDEALRRRGMAAYKVVAGLQHELSTTIESLRRVSRLADADVTSVRDFHSGGLPTPNLDLLQDESFIAKPWWAGIVPSLAAGLIERRVRRGFESEIGEVVQFYDRQVQLWLKTNCVRLVDLYETQASVFREQIRRLTSESADWSLHDSDESLENDLRGLRQNAAETDSKLIPQVDADQTRCPS
jgi:hypothetical protein